jgi:hypothetical protein
VSSAISGAAYYGSTGLQAHIYCLPGSINVSASFVSSLRSAIEFVVMLDLMKTTIAIGALAVSVEARVFNPRQYGNGSHPNATCLYKPLVNSVSIRPILHHRFLATPKAFSVRPCRNMQQDRDNNVALLYQFGFL